MKRIDMHTHVLPGMDDGSSDVHTSCQMLKNLFEQGVTTICVTPHFYAKKEEIDSFVMRRSESLEALLQAAGDKRNALVVGAETAYFRGISECTQLDKLCYENTHTLLLEMPYAAWENYQVEEVVSLVLDRNYQVILAHPERYLSRGHNDAYIEKLLQLPIALQVNADPLLEWKNRRRTLKLLQMTEYPLLGSDCHDLKMRSPRIGRARNMIEKKLGKEFTELMDRSAQKLLFGAAGGEDHE